MRNVICALATAAAVLALAACGSDKTDTVTATDTVTDTVTATDTVAAAPTTTTSDNSVAQVCQVTNVPNVTPPTVQVQLAAGGYPPSAQALIGCPVAQRLVNFVAEQKAQEPVSTKDFTCTPSVNGPVSQWICEGDTGTGNVNYAFTLVYKQ